MKKIYCSYSLKCTSSICILKNGWETKYYFAGDKISLKKELLECNNPDEKILLVSEFEYFVMRELYENDNKR